MILVRLIVGGVFLFEGVQKFLFPDALGVGRFSKIRIPTPQLMAPFVGFVEIVCGGLLMRLAAVPLVIDAIVAIATTKVPRLIDDGFWNMAHEARTGWARILGARFLALAGAGPVSAEDRFVR